MSSFFPLIFSVSDLCIIFDSHSANKFFVFIAFRMVYYHCRESGLAQIFLLKKDSYFMSVFLK